MGRLPYPYRSLTCSLSDRKPYWTGFQYECLPLVVLEERCREEGKSVKLGVGYGYCDSGPPGEVSVCYQK